MKLPYRLSSTAAWKSAWSAGAIGLVAGRLTNATCGLLQVPFALKALGVEAFGLWSTLTGLLWTLAVLDGGLGYALQNRLARLLAERRHADASELARTGARILWIAAAGLVALGLPLCFALPWADWLGVDGAELRRQTPTALGTAVVLGGILVPLTLSSRLAAARQETWRSGVWLTAGSLLGLGAVIAAGELAATMPVFVAASGVVPLTLHLGQTWQLKLTQSGRNPEVRRAPPALGGILRESTLFFLPQLGAVFVGAFLPVMVALFAGAGAAASFSVAQRLFGMVTQLNTLVLQPTWPAYTHASTRGDAAAARSVYRSSFWIATAAAGITLAVAPFAEGILRLWLCSRPPPLEPSLIWTIAGWNALQCFGQPPAMVLNGLGRNAAIAALSWIIPVAGASLCFLLGPAHGAAGVVASIAVPYLLFNLPIIYVLALRALGPEASGSTRR